MPTLPKGTKFYVPKSGNKKYKVIIPQRGGKTKTVQFGDRRYEHFRDSVPRSMGGGQWSDLNHNDAKRRKNYRARHAGAHNKDGKRSIDVRYSPAWFSYHFLW